MQMLPLQLQRHKGRYRSEHARTLPTSRQTLHHKVPVAFPGTSVGESCCARRHFSYGLAGLASLHRLLAMAQQQHLHSSLEFQEQLLQEAPQSAQTPSLSWLDLRLLLRCRPGSPALQLLHQNLAICQRTVMSAALQDSCQETVAHPKLNHLP